MSPHPHVPEYGAGLTVEDRFSGHFLAARIDYRGVHLRVHCGAPPTAFCRDRTRDLCRVAKELDNTYFVSDAYCGPEAELRSGPIRIQGENDSDDYIWGYPPESPPPDTTPAP